MPKNLDPELAPLFEPDSIAVVGASPESPYTSQLLENVDGNDCTVYPVNPSRDKVLGITCFDSIIEVPETVDLAIISIPREYVVDVVREAGESDVGAALIISAGFSEADEKGETLENELKEVLTRYDIRVAGPQSVGLVNAKNGLVLTSLLNDAPPNGSLGIVSQSGGFAFTALERGVDMNVNPAYAIATGNEVDLTLTDYLEYMVESPDVSAIIAYIEGLDDPQRFMDVADRATRKGTPVITIKIGNSEMTERTTQSHTGSITGPDAGWEAAFSQTGVEKVADMPDLLNRARAHTTFSPPSSNRVCVVTSSGGYMNMLADMAENRGLEFPDIQKKTKQQLLEFDILAFDELHNPVDVRGYGMEVLPEIAEVVYEDDSFDSYVFVYESQAVGEQAERVADNFIAAAERASDPVFILWPGRRQPKSSGETEGPFPFERVQEEVPLFSDAQPCMDALSSLVKFGQIQEKLEDRLPRATRQEERKPPEIDFSADQILSWRAAEKLLDDFGIQTVETRLVTDAQQGRAEASNLGYPVVMKIDSPDIPHRAEKDAVVTNIESSEEAFNAYNDIMQNVSENAPSATVNGVLIQPQREGEIEALVGMTRDSVFGPLMTIGVGGTLVELLDESSTLVPPIVREEAEESIAETKLRELLSNNATISEGSRAELVSLITNLSRLVINVDKIAEIDLNPVMICPNGIEVVDVLVRTD